MENRDYYDEFADRYERERHDGYHALIDELEVMPFGWRLQVVSLVAPSATHI
jgi:hypothetical protein